MSGSVFDEIQDKISNSSSEHELIQALIDSVGILGKESDATLQDLAEVRHEVQSQAQYIDELQEQIAKLKGVDINYESEV